MAEFNVLKEWARMVKLSETGSCTIPCSECGMEVSRNAGCLEWALLHPKEAEAIIRKWAEEHPAKTRQSEFLKLFPNAAFSENGILTICPIKIDTTADCSNDCKRCKERYWKEEV